MKQAYAGLALLTDLDGTLLRPDKTVAPEDAAAIADFRAKGGLFSFATGRGQQASQAYLELFQPDFPVVMYNGALLIDPKTGESAGAEYLPADARALLEELAAAFPDVGAEVLHPEGVFVFQDSEIERKHLSLTNVPFVMRTLDEANPALLSVRRGYYGCSACPYGRGRPCVSFCMKQLLEDWHRERAGVGKEVSVYA